MYIKPDKSLYEWEEQSNLNVKQRSERLKEQAILFIFLPNKWVNPKQLKMEDDKMLVNDGTVKAKAASFDYLCIN